MTHDGKIPHTDLDRYSGLTNPPGVHTEMVLFCKNLTGKTLIVPTYQECSIEEFKAKIYAMEGIPPECQTLVHYRTRRELMDGRSFIDYNIRGEETLSIILRLRGSTNPYN